MPDAHIPDDYLNGTKYEMPLMLHERGGDVISLGKVVVLADGTRVAVLKRSVSKEEREELFYGLNLDKIINEKEVGHYEASPDLSEWERSRYGGPVGGREDGRVNPFPSGNP